MQLTEREWRILLMLVAAWLVLDLLIHGGIPPLPSYSPVYPWE